MSIINRIKQIIEYKGISTRKFCINVGISNGFFDKVKDVGSEKLLKILNTYPEISAEWLLTGNGSMIKDCKIVASEPDITFKTKMGEIPLIPVEAMADFVNKETFALHHESEYYFVPAFRNAEFLIQINGDSMFPKYSSGDIIACKRLSLKNIFFQWNKTYVIDTVQGVLIKRVKKASSKDFILIVSDNPAYEPFEIPISEIRSIATVVGVMRLE